MGNYIGTNQGLFYKEYQTDNEFKFINGTKGQVWSLFEYDGTLFCGHDSGTFIDDDGAARNIFTKLGTWKLYLIKKTCCFKEITMEFQYWKKLIICGVLELK